MNFTESYPTYKRKNEFESFEIYPSLVRLLLLFIGSLDIVFGGIFLLVLLQKMLFEPSIIIVISVSWIGGISCLKVATQQNMKKLNVFLIMCLGLGVTLGIFYFYIIGLVFHIYR